MSIRSVGVCGLGHVGIPLVSALAKVGYRVIGCDVDSKKVRELSENYSIYDIYEPGLNECLMNHRKRIEFTCDYECMMKKCEAVIVTVGTPMNYDSPDFGYLDSCIKSIGQHLLKGQLVILKSTVIPGTTLGYVLPMLERFSGLKAGQDFYLAYCPERIIEGMALYELHNLPKIIGGVDSKSVELAACLLEKLGGKVIKVSSPTVGEMCKLADNVYRTVNIVLANELASLCEALGVDSHELVSAVNSAYARTHIYTPGLGAHGPCLPKDTRMARYLALKSNVMADVLDACIKGSDRPISKVKAIISHFIEEKELIDPKIALLGLAFKGWPETVDVRSSPAVELLSYLRETGISRVSMYDPLVREVEGMTVCKSVCECVKGANVILQLTDHPALMNLSVQALLDFASRPLLIVDCWHTLKSIEYIDDEVSIYVMGRGWYPSRSS